MPDAPPGPAGGIVLRPFAAGDAEALAALWFDSWRSTSPTADLHVTRGDLRMRIDRDLAAGREITVAAGVNGLLGFLSIDRAQRRLEQLFVASAAKRRGVGRRLFQIARAEMPDGFSLRAAADNTGARAFYEALGMTLERTEPHPKRGYLTAVYSIGGSDRADWSV